MNITDIILNNPITGLSSISQNKLLNKVKNTFTTDEQTIFVSNFYMYLNNQNNYCIDIDKILNWLGFLNKRNIKDLLQKYFQENIDYKIEKKKEKKIGGFGSTPEIILIKTETFKQLCMLCNTEKGKEIRLYYLKLEKILQETIDEETNEIRLELSRSQDLLNSTKLALDMEKEKTKQILKKRYHGEEPSQAVYIYVNNPDDPNSMIKIGKTTNIAIRETEYNTCNNTGRMIFSQKCHNCDLLEKVLHHILDKYRYIQNREWFDLDVDTAIYVVQTTHLFIDKLIPCIEKIPKTNLKLFIENIVSNFTEDEKKVEIKNEISIYQKVNEQKEIEKKEFFEKVNNEIQTLENQEQIDPLDFNKFVEKYCIFGDDFYCIKNELYGAHKIWSRSTDCKKKLYKYCDEKFKSGKKYIEKYNATLAIFKGIKLKEFKPDYDKKSEFTNFIEDVCKIGYLYRITNKHLQDEWIKWKSDKIPDYVFDINEKRKIQNWMMQYFLPIGVHIAKDVDEPGKGTRSHGLWGITLKSDETNVGLKICKALRKPIAKIDVKSNEVIKIYDSLAEACRDNKVDISTMSETIKFNKIRNGHQYKQVDKDYKLNMEENFDENSDEETEISEKKDNEIIDSETKSEDSTLKFTNEIFAKFLTECFLKQTNYKTSWIDITSRFKIWSKTNDQFKEVLSEFLEKNNVKKTYLFDSETKMNVTAYEGITMIPLPNLYNITSADYEDFLMEKCVINVTGRICVKDLYEKFIVWKKERDSKYKNVHYTQKEKIEEYLKKFTFKTTVHTGERNRPGFLGISWKGEENIGTRSKNSSRKKVEKVDRQNNIIDTYDSMTHAAAQNNTTISTISSAISGNKMYKGFFYRLAQ